MIRRAVNIDFILVFMALMTDETKLVHEKNTYPKDPCPTHILKDSKTPGLIVVAVRADR